MGNSINSIHMKLPISIDEQGENWVQSILSNLSLDEKIGQLIHIAGWSNKSENHIKEIENLISKYNIGGLIFFQGDPLSQAKLTNQYQRLTKVPLMISIDAEWGLGMRLNEVESFPYQMTLGALEDDTLIYEMGKAIGKQLKRVGVNLNQAPVVDINTNPKNQVIGFRSFGQDKNKVAEKAKAYMRGLHDEQILACAKHFPGHGDTMLDSHVALPILNKSKKDLTETEFIPFKELINEGLGAIMTAHLNVPRIEPDENRASTLSKTIIDGILKNEIGYLGLVLTDALDMKAVSDYYKSGALEVEALKAGNDILLFVKDVELAISEIKKAVIKGEIDEETINEKCAKQLAYKYWMGLMNYKPIELENIVSEINQYTSGLNSQIYAQSATLLKKETSFPAQHSKTLLVSVFAKGDQPEEGSLNHHTTLKSVFGNDKKPVFAQNMSKYFTNSSQISVKENQLDALDQELRHGHYDHVILSVHNVKIKAKDNFGFSAGLISLISQIITTKNTHLVFFGNAYALDKIANLEYAKSILLAYQENKYTHDQASKILKNEEIPAGKLPVTINEFFPMGTGLTK